MARRSSLLLAVDDPNLLDLLTRVFERHLVSMLARFVFLGEEVTPEAERRDARAAARRVRAAS